MISNQIQFTSISIRNFLSYGNNTTIVAFDRQGSTLVTGEDLDNTTNGKTVNGIGKTSVFNALTYGVYDKTISNISKDNLVNNINQKNMVVTVEFKKGNDCYIIERARKTKAGAAGNYVNFHKKHSDGTLENLARSNKDTNLLITQTIGVSYDLFCQTVVFSATKTPFLDLPIRHPQQTNQTQMIEQLFGLTELTEKAEIIKANTKILSDKLERLETKTGQIEREHARHQEHIKTATQRVIKWDKDNKATIDNLHNDLLKIESVDIDNQRTLHDERATLTKANKDLTTQITTLETSIKTHLKTKKASSAELIHLNSDKCPYCLQEFKDANTKIESLITSIDEIDNKVVDISDSIEALQNGVAENQQAIDLINQSITVSNIEELIQIKSKSAQTIERIAELENAVNPFIEPLDELESTVLDDLNYDELNALRKTIDHEKFLVKLLTKRDSFVRKVLLNKNLPFLNKRLAHYLAELGLPHKVEFNGELEAQISRFGHLLDFGNLSNGQRARVNIALSFSFRDVLQKLHNPINICLLDEILDVGLDSVGVQAAARLIKQMARDEHTNVYIISHREELESAFDRTMTVQMSKGFSYIKDEVVE